jgi:predicted NBD/HSP70 family sugar kinase
MKRTGDQYLVKEINLSIVLDTIRRLEPVSRSEISAATGLNKGTVSNLVQVLIGRNLVEEVGTGQSSGGRKPVLLRFQPGAGHAVGVDLGVNYIRILLTDLAGRIVDEWVTAHRNESLDAVLDLVKDGIRRAAGRAPASCYGVIGAGIGIPGIVDPSGNVLFAPNLGWRNVDLPRLLSAELGMPVFVENEANAGAIGELHYGSGRDIADLVFVSIGAGIGAGIIIDRAIYKGAAGFSGEIGHMTIHAEGKPCRCGNRGCWELYASESAMLALAAEAAADGKAAPATLEAVIGLARAGDPGVMDALRAIGRNLGIGVAGIINIFNPGQIIIGSRMGMAAEWLMEPLLAEVESRSLAYSREKTEIRFSALDGRSTALGASHLAISAFLRDSTAALP